MNSKLNAAANATTWLLIVSTIMFSLIAVMSVWNPVNDEVISKSLLTIGVLGLIMLATNGAANFLADKNNGQVMSAEEIERQNDVNKHFGKIRELAAWGVVVLLMVMALVGILAIWEIFTGDTLERFISTVGILAFGSFIIMVSAAIREEYWKKSPYLQKHGTGSFILLLFVLWIFGIIIF